jgi:hypothetical protein
MCRQLFLKFISVFKKLQNSSCSVWLRYLTLNPEVTINHEVLNLDNQRKYPKIKDLITSLTDDSATCYHKTAQYTQLTRHGLCHEWEWLKADCDGIRVYCTIWKNLISSPLLESVKPVFLSQLPRLDRTGQTILQPGGTALRHSGPLSSRFSCSHLSKWKYGKSDHGDHGP